jgi:hypothetical protein
MFYLKAIDLHCLDSLLNIFCKIKLRRKYRQDMYHSCEVRKHFIINLKSEVKRSLEETLLQMRVETKGTRM